MLKVLLFSLVTTSSSFTMHRYDAYDSYGNYRPSAPLLENIFGYENSNGRRPVQVYEYARRYDGVVISDLFQGPVVISDGGRRRVDMPYSYQNPYDWNRQVPSNRAVVTESTKIYNRLENSDQDSNNPDTRNRSPVVQQDKDEVTNQRKLTNELNITLGNVSVPQICKQLDDFNRTLVINEQSNDHRGSSEDKVNITTKSINSDNNSNSFNAPNKQNSYIINRLMKTNNRTANTTINDRNRPTNTTDGSNKYSTKTTEDNEVTPRVHEQRTKSYDDDIWIWSNGENQVVATTIQTDIDDRAAFSGDACPNGMYKVGNICVAKD